MFAGMYEQSMSSLQSIKPGEASKEEDDEFLIIEDPFDTLETEVDLKFTEQRPEAKIRLPADQCLRTFAYMRLIQ